MIGKLLLYGPQCGSYLLEVGLLLYILRRGHLKRLAALSAYLACLLGADAARDGVLFLFGFASRTYAYCYWISDVVLTLAAFLLVCALFRRACVDQAKMWKQLRVLLAAVFVLVLAITSGSIAHNYSNLFSNFIIEFSQNFIFSCLVLVTMLYLFLMHSKSADDELILLVTGMGIQFAGPAAVLALFHLTSGQGFARTLAGLMIPVCNLAKLSIWFYAVARVPKLVTRPLPERKAGAVPLHVASRS